MWWEWFNERQSTPLCCCFVSLQPTIDHRFDSYYNYCELFNLILSEFQLHVHISENYSSQSVHSDTDEPIDLELPNKWLWDIVDEFIYQVSVIPNLIPTITFP